MPSSGLSIIRKVPPKHYHSERSEESPHCRKQIPSFTTPTATLSPLHEGHSQPEARHPELVSESPTIEKVT